MFKSEGTVRMEIEMINIALCFENDAELYFMRTELCKCFDQRGIDYNIYGYHNTTELRCGIQHRCPDLFFYDIMGEYGLVRMAAHSLKKLNPKLVSVVFKDKNYIERIDDILLEPFYTIPNKSRKSLWTYAFLAYEAAFDEEDTFSYYKRPSYVHIPFDSIKYFASEGRCTHMICTDAERDNIFYKKLRDVETLISTKHCTFFRIHQSYLINAKYVDSYNRSHVFLTTGEMLPISKYEYYKAISKQIAEKKLRSKYRLRA